MAKHKYQVHLLVIIQLRYYVELQVGDWECPESARTFQILPGPQTLYLGFGLKKMVSKVGGKIIWVSHKLLDASYTIIQ